MTSGGGVHYKSMFDCGSQIIKKEGAKSLFKGAGANIIRGVAGAGVLSLYDKIQEVLFGKVYSGGMESICWLFKYKADGVLQALVKMPTPYRYLCFGALHRSLRILLLLAILSLFLSPVYCLFRGFLFVQIEHRKVI